MTVDGVMSWPPDEIPRKMGGSRWEGEEGALETVRSKPANHGILHDYVKDDQSSMVVSAKARQGKPRGG